MVKLILCSLLYLEILLHNALLEPLLDVRESVSETDQHRLSRLIELVKYFEEPSEVIEVKEDICTEHYIDRVSCLLLDRLKMFLVAPE